MAATTSPTKAAPLPTSVGTFKSMSANNVTEVRWVGGWRGGGLGYRGVGWRGGGWGYRGGGWGYRPWGALAAGAVVEARLPAEPITAAATTADILITTATPATDMAAAAVAHARTRRCFLLRR